MLLAKGDGSPQGGKSHLANIRLLTRSQPSLYPLPRFSTESKGWEPSHWWKQQLRSSFQIVNIKLNPEAEVKKSREKHQGGVEVIPMAPCDLKFLFCVCYFSILGISFITDIIVAVVHWSVAQPLVHSAFGPDRDLWNPVPSSELCASLPYVGYKRSLQT